MTVRSVTTLGYALLGLIRELPRSGYRLRRVFETTPLGSYSSSPGSIYPALRSLEKAGLVRRDADEGAGGGPVFRLTAEGETVFRGWLERPVDTDEIADHRNSALLRFAFLQFHPDRRLSLDFLESYAEASRAQAQGLVDFLESPTGRDMSLQSRLSVEHGLEGVRSAARWAERARKRLETQMEEERA